MWILNLALTWVWVVPLMMLGMCAVCVLLMLYGRHSGGCHRCGGNRPHTRTPDQQ
jgi:hypothetical protein